MPCSSGHMEASRTEKEISQVACLLDELNGTTFTKDHWAGYHPRVYCHCSKSLADSLVSELCSRLQKLDVTKYSLEMQIWWRDHKKADQQRLQKEIAAEATEADKTKALAKLTDYEMGLLGLK